MSDVSGVSAESSPAPEVMAEPNPISTEPQGQPEPDAKPEGKPEKAEKTEAKPISTREALMKAAEKVEKDAKATEKPEVKAEAKPEKDKPEVKTEAKRDETGKFAPKEDKPAVKTEPKVEAKPSHTDDDAPARFTETAKAKWQSADPELRGEVLRMHRELTQGYEKHKAAAERDAGLNEFHEMAKQSGKELPNVVREYVNMENHLRKDLVGGLDIICQRMGVSFRDVAAHVMGQTPDQNASKQDATIRELKSKIEQLEGQVGNVSKTFQQQRETAVHSEVQEWAKDKPLFEVLAPHIADYMRESGNTNLDDAYNAVLQKHPQLAALSAPKPAASSAPVIDLSVQTEKGQKSIQGSPTPGSDPVSKRAPSTSIKESLKRAMAQAG